MLLLECRAALHQSEDIAADCGLYEQGQGDLPAMVAERTYAQVAAEGEGSRAPERYRRRGQRPERRGSAWPPCGGHTPDLHAMPTHFQMEAFLGRLISETLDEKCCE